MKPIGISLNEIERATLEAAAKASGVSVAHVVRSLIPLLLDGQPVSVAPTDRRERFRRGCNGVAAQSELEEHEER